MQTNMHLTLTATSAPARRTLQRMRGEIARFTGSVNRATAATMRMNASMRLRNLNMFAKDLQWIGRQIEFNFTLPLLLAGGFATKFALENERAMTRVRKVYNPMADDSQALTRETDLLGESFRLLSDRMGVQQDEVIGIGAMWAQAGANGKALAEATELTMKTMVLGEMEATMATEALLAIQQQYQVQVSDTSDEIVSLTDIMATLNAVENETAVNFQGLVESFQRSAGIARTAGVSHRELAAATAALVPTAANARQAGISLRTTISRIMAPTTKAAKALGEVGININDAAWASSTFTERLYQVSDAYQDLTENQQNSLASILAGRRQVSRFNVLMADLANEQGRYAKALEVTATQQDAMNRFNEELRIYLESTPQGFAILTQQIRNLATEAIQPILPLLMNLLTAARDLIRSFMELDQSTKQLIFNFAVFLMLIGPIQRIFGAFLMLFKTMAGLGLFLAGVLAKVWGAFKILGAIASGAATIIVSSVATIGVAFVQLPFWIAKGMMASVSWIALMWTRISALFVVAFTKLGAISTAGFAFLRQIWAMGVGLLKGTWVLGEVLMTVILSFRNIGAISVRGFAFLSKIWAAGVAVLTNPWVLLVGAILGILYLFRDAIYEFIQDILDAWGAMPEGIANVMISIVRVIRDAALAVYEWLQWMNPFARHSPSLVEQVKSGVNLIAAQYASLSNIGVHFSRAVDDLRAFTAATENARRALENKEFAEMRLDVVSAAPGAGGEFDAVVASIRRLEAALAAIQIEYDAQAKIVAKWEQALKEANTELAAQELILDGLADHADNLEQQLGAAQDRLADLIETPIQGMGEMSDAIFENEIAQKRLRLEILRMEEAFGTIDDLRDRMAALSGDIDMLNAERENLRLAGAGSDVLGAIDTQLAQLEAERRALGGLSTGPTSEMADLQAQLEELEHAGQILNLEQSVQFDPMVRQIEQVTESMEEMPFDQLLERIIAEQDQVDVLTGKWNTATQAMENQQAVVDQLTSERDAIEARYDAEIAKLEELEDAYVNIEKQIDAMRTALESFSTAASSASGGAGTKDVLGVPGEFDIPGGTGADLTGGNIEEFNDRMREELDGLFEFDIWQMLRDQWDKFVGFLRSKWTEFTDWLSTKGIDLSMIASGTAEAFSNLSSNLRERWDELVGDINWDAFGEAFDNVMSAIDPLITAFSELWEMLREFFIDTWDEINENWGLGWEDMTRQFQAAWNVWSTIFKVVLAVFMTVFTAIWPIVRNTLQAIFDFISEIIGAVVRIFTGVVQFISGVFTGDWDKAWEGIKNIFGGVWDAIVAILKGVWDIIVGVVTGAIEGVLDLWNWFKEQTGITWNKILETLTDWAIRALEWAINFFPNLINSALDAWATLRTKTREVWDAILRKAGEVWESIKSKIAEKVDQIKSTVQGIKDFIVRFVQSPFQTMKNVLNGIWNAVAQKVEDIWNGIMGAVETAISWVGSKLQWLVDTWNSMPWNDLSISFEWEEGRAPTVAIDRNTRPSGGSLASYTAFQHGAVLDRPTLGLMAEYAGARSNPEIVTPERLMSQVFGQVLDSRLENMGGSSNRIIQINGNLEFPNIDNGEDAENFVRNLEAMVD